MSNPKTEMVNQPLNRLEDRDGEGEEREWMVYGVAIVTAKTREEAIEKCERKEIVEPWEVLNDAGGFFRPEPYDRGVVVLNRGLGIDPQPGLCNARDTDGVLCVAPEGHEGDVHRSVAISGMVREWRDLHAAGIVRNPAQDLRDAGLIAGPRKGGA